ncbi:hypothetical protein D3C75_811560 [compost metagenome]
MQHALGTAKTLELLGNRNLHFVEVDTQGAVELESHHERLIGGERCSPYTRFLAALLGPLADILIQGSP